MKKRMLSILLALVMCVSMLPMQVFAAQDDSVTVTLDPESKIFSEAETSALATSLLTLDSEGQVALKATNEVEWVDRLDLTGADYALDFYAYLVENSVEGGALRTADVAEYTAATFTGAGKFTYTGDSAVDSEAALAAITADMKANWNEASAYLSAVYYAFDRDHPEVFWLSGESMLRQQADYTYSSDGIVTYTQTVCFVLRDVENSFDIRDGRYLDESLTLDEEWINDMDAEGQAFATELSMAFGEIAEAESLWMALHALHHNLTTSNEYNTSADLSSADSVCWEYITAIVGSEGDKGPVCEAYARAFKVVCDKMGIPCVLVDGWASADGENGEAHMWNYVQMDDGLWYAVDVTWDDPVVAGVTGVQSGYENENYFLVGGDTEINGIPFMDSHLVSNSPSASAPAFTNGPVLSADAYVATEIPGEGGETEEPEEGQSGFDLILTVEDNLLYYQLILPDTESAEAYYVDIIGTSRWSSSVWLDYETNEYKGHLTAFVEAGTYDTAAVRSYTDPETVLAQWTLDTPIIVTSGTATLPATLALEAVDQTEDGMAVAYKLAGAEPGLAYSIYVEAQSCVYTLEYDSTWDTGIVWMSDPGETVELYSLCAAQTAAAYTLDISAPSVLTVPAYVPGGGETEEPTLTQIPAPTDLNWGRYYYRDYENDVMIYAEYPGMMSWRSGTFDYRHNVEIKVYRVTGDPEDELVWRSRWYCGRSDLEYNNDHDFSLAMLEELESGTYYFTAQAIGDGETTADSELVTSDTWTYTHPTERLSAPTGLAWDGFVATWDRVSHEDVGGYAIDIYYSSDESGENLEFATGFVQYSCEGEMLSFDPTFMAMAEKGTGYYWFEVKTVSADMNTILHSEYSELSEPVYFEFDWALDENGVLTIRGNGPIAGYWEGDSTITKVVIEDGITSIPGWVFCYCENLTEVVIPGSVKEIGYAAFEYCPVLEKITFTGDAPYIEEYAFDNVTATCYYPADNDTWTEAVMQNYGGTLTWVPVGGETETGCLLTFNFPADLCDVYATVANTTEPVYRSGDRVEAGTYLAYTITDIADGYRIKSVVMNGVDRTQGFVNGAYGGLATTIKEDVTVDVELELIPEVLPSVDSVTLYMDSAFAELAADNVTVDDDTRFYGKATYSDGVDYPVYYIGGVWEYSTDGINWKQDLAWGSNRFDYWPGWTSRENFDPDAGDFFVTGSYDLRLRVVPKDLYSTGAEVLSNVIHVNGGAAGSEEPEEPNDLAVTDLHFLRISNSIVLEWTAPANAEEAGVEYYEVYYSTDGGETWEYYTSSSDTSSDTYADGFLPGGVYNAFKVETWLEGAEEAAAETVAELTLTVTELYLDAADVSIVYPASDEEEYTVTVTGLTPNTELKFQFGYNGLLYWTYRDSDENGTAVFTLFNDSMVTERLTNLGSKYLIQELSGFYCGDSTMEYVTGTTAGYTVTTRGDWTYVSDAVAGGETIVRAVVNFDLNTDDENAWGDPSPITIEAGDTVELPVRGVDFDRAYYVFKGWFTEPEGGEQVTNETPITEDCTLYAHWELRTTVTLILYVSEILGYDENGEPYGDWVEPGTYTLTMTAPDGTVVPAEAGTGAHEGGWLFRDLVAADAYTLTIEREGYKTYTISTLDDPYGDGVSLAEIGLHSGGVIFSTAGIWEPEESEEPADLAVSNLHFEYLGANTMPFLYWTVPANVEGDLRYNVYASTDGGESWTMVSSTSQEMMSLTGLAAAVYTVFKVETNLDGKVVAECSAKLTLTVTQGEDLPAATVVFTAPETEGDNYEILVSGLTPNAWICFTMKRTNGSGSSGSTSNASGEYTDSESWDNMSKYLADATSAYLVQEFSNPSIAEDGLSASFTVSNRGDWASIADAVVGGGSTGETTENKLMFRDLYWNEEGALVESEWLFTGWNPSVLASMRTRFYFGTEDSYVAVDPDSLSVSGKGIYLECEYTEDGTVDYVWIHTIAFGDYQVIYTHTDGKEYSVPVSVGLPEVGFYSQPVASEENYLWEQFTVTEGNNTFYFVPREGKLTRVALDERFAGIATAEIAEGGYAVITVTATPDGDWYHLNFDFEDTYGNSFTNWGEGLNIKNGIPHLMYRGFYWNENDEMVEDKWFQSEYHASIQSGMRARFYFGTEDSFVAATPDNLTVSGDGIYLEWVYTEDGAVDNVIVHAVDFGDYEVIYTTDDGTKYTLPVTVGLPDVGFYSESVASEKSYLYEAFTVTAENNTFYLVPINGALTNVELLDELAGIATVTMGENGSYAAITVTGTPSGRWYNMRVEFTDSYGNSRSWGVGLQLKDGNPHLMFRNMYWDNENQCYYEDPEAPLQSSLDTVINAGGYWKIYFGTADEYVEVSLDQLTVTGGLTLSQDGEFIWIHTYEFGEYQVIYTDTDGVNYTLPVSVGLPLLGFYSQPVANEKSYLYEEFTVTAENNGVYLIANGYTLSNVTLLDDFANIASVEIAEDGSYAAITVTGTPSGRWYQLMADYGNENWSATGRYANLQLKDGNPHLMFRYESSEGLHSQWEIEPGMSSHLIFYFGTEGNYAEVDFDSLSVSDSSALTLSEGDGFVRVTAGYVCGEYSIIYTDENGKTYELPVVVALPDVGVYSTSFADPYTRTIRFVVTDESDTFYVVSVGGGMDGVTLSAGLAEIAEITEHGYNEDGEYIAIKVTGTPVSGVWYEIELVYYGYDGLSKGTRIMSVMLEDTRTVAPEEPEIIASGVCGDNLTWELKSRVDENGENCYELIINGTGAMYDYSYTNRPGWYEYHEQIKWIELSAGQTTVGAHAFENCYYVTELTIPDSVESVGEDAFVFVSHLEKLDLGDGLKTIGRAAFYGCGKSLTEVVIPDSVTYIGVSAFASCDVLTKVTLGSGLITIDYYAFQYDESLTEIIIPDSVATIGYQAFDQCYGLTKVTIGSGVTNIEGGAFASCIYLTEVTFTGSAPAIASDSFAGVPAICYYPALKDGWTSEMLANYGGTLTWKPYGYEDNTQKVGTIYLDKQHDEIMLSWKAPEKPRDDLYYHVTILDQNGVIWGEIDTYETQMEITYLEQGSYTVRVASCFGDGLEAAAAETTLTVAESNSKYPAKVMIREDETNVYISGLNSDRIHLFEVEDGSLYRVVSDTEGLGVVYGFHYSSRAGMDYRVREISLERAADGSLTVLYTTLGWAEESEGWYCLDDALPASVSPEVVETEGLEGLTEAETEALLDAAEGVTVEMVADQVMDPVPEEEGSTVEVEIVLNVTVTGYNALSGDDETAIVSGTKALTLDIEPVAIVTTTDAQGVSSSTTQTVDTTGTYVLVKIPLPTGFAEVGDVLYVIHTKDDGSMSSYRVTVMSDENGGLYVSFMNANGFSEFTVTNTVATMTFTSPSGVVQTEEYENLEVAMMMAKVLSKNGSTDITVKLLCDVEVGGIVIPSGVTLDLGEATLTADYVVGLSGGYLTATANAGKLIVAQGGLILPEEGYRNTKGQYILPIWDPEQSCYLFSLFVVNTNNANRGLFIDEETETIRFQFKHQATGAINQNLLNDGSSDNALKVIVRLVWESENGEAYQDFVYNDGFVKKVAVGENGVSYDYSFTLSGYSIMNIDLSTLRVIGMIITDSGAVACGETWTIENSK